MVFAESGLFFGFFFPGDSLLFSSGFLASQGFFNIYILVPLVIIAAIGGDSAGFWTGSRFIGWLMKRKESFFFKREYIKKAKKFYNKHGGKALVLARFVPAVRTFVPIVAGMSGMEYKNFVKFNILGGFLWGGGVSLSGFYLGNLVPNVDKYLLPIIILIIIISVAPYLFHLKKEIKKTKIYHPLITKILKFKEEWLG